MKLEEGMYVRTKYGEIARIDECKGKDKVYKNMEHYETDRMVTKFNNFILYKEDISKASHNIIDLIEVGDILILDLWQHENSKQVVYEADDIKVIYMYDMHIPITNDEIVIKSILTKEQFESMSYKVGEE